MFRTTSAFINSIGLLRARNNPLAVPPTHPLILSPKRALTTAFLSQIQPTHRSPHYRVFSFPHSRVAMLCCCCWSNRREWRLPQHESSFEKLDINDNTRESVSVQPEPSVEEGTVVSEAVKNSQATGRPESNTGEAADMALISSRKEVRFFIRFLFMANFLCG